MTQPVRPVDVSGGVGGIEAHAHDITELARLFGRAATDTCGAAAALHGYLADLGVGLSSVFDPLGAAEFETALAWALDGPGGLTLLAARCATLDVDLRAAAATYVAVDRLETVTVPIARGVAGLPRAAWSGVRTFGETGSPRDAVSASLAEDPELFDPAVDLLGGPRGLLAGKVTGLLGDGAPVVRAGGRDAMADAYGPPRSLADVVTGLARRDAGGPGEIDVRRLVGADGSTCYIVDIPGTKSWSPLPTADVTSLATNLRAIAGRTTSYERGVIAAMSAAGISRTDQVLLVGHSEGGMVAVNAAAACARSRRFNVTHVLTAGSPIGSTAARVPARVQVLALENRGDVVPELDGLDNAPKPNVTTVTVHHDQHQVGTNHALLTAYLPGAADTDHTSDPSVVAYRASAAPFLSATGISTTRFVVSRGY